MFKRKKSKEPKIKTPRFKTIRDAYAVTKSVKPWIGIVLIATFLIVLALGITLGIIFNHPVYGGFVTIPVAVLAAIKFARNTELVGP